jgi:hypothetical protein
VVSSGEHSGHLLGGRAQELELRWRLATSASPLTVRSSGLPSRRAHAAPSATFGPGAQGGQWRTALKPATRRAPGRHPLCRSLSLSLGCKSRCPSRRVASPTPTRGAFSLPRRRARVDPTLGLRSTRSSRQPNPPSSLQHLRIAASHSFPTSCSTSPPSPSSNFGQRWAARAVGAQHPGVLLAAASAEQPAARLSTASPVSPVSGVAATATRGPRRGGGHAAEQGSDRRRSTHAVDSRTARKRGWRQSTRVRGSPARPRPHRRRASPPGFFYRW